MKRAYLTSILFVLILSTLIVFGVTKRRMGSRKRNVLSHYSRVDFESTLFQTYTNASYYNRYPKDIETARALLGKAVGESNTLGGRLKYPSIYIRRFGRLGNNIIELSNAIYLSEIMNASTIYIPENFAWIDTPMTTSKGISIVPTNTRPKDVVVLRRELFRLSDGNHYPESRIHEFADEILKKVPPVSIDSDGLYIHIRSGDVFEENPNPAYGQPPLCFYESIIEKWRFRDIYIICEDTKNPVINPLIKKYDAKVVNKELPETMAIILNAKNLVMSVGTFLPSLLKLAPEDTERRIFRYGNSLECNRDIWKTFYFTGISDFYESNIMGFSWNNTAEQNMIMLNETCGDEWKVSMYTTYPN